MGFCDRRRFKFVITAINHWQHKRILKVERTHQHARGLPNLAESFIQQGFYLI
jgi:hypothetical protein